MGLFKKAPGFDISKEPPTAEEIQEARWYFSKMKKILLFLSLVVIFILVTFVFGSIFSNIQLRISGLLDTHPQDNPVFVLFLAFIVYVVIMGILSLGLFLPLWIAKRNLSFLNSIDTVEEFEAVLTLASEHPEVENYRRKVVHLRRTFVEGDLEAMRQVEKQIGACGEETATAQKIEGLRQKVYSEQL